MAKVDSTLATRETNYGSFADNAETSQLIQGILFKDKDKDFSPVQKEALQLISIKLARFVNGNPDYADNWHDIAGYAKLAEEELGAERES